MIQENIGKIWERIEKATSRTGRKKEQIRLVAVTKGVAAEKIVEAVHYGIQEIGESRVQESQDKFQILHSISPSLKRHMIGALQRNKVNRSVEIFDCIQSVDSVKLIETINRRASEIGKVQSCLIEVKVSNEPNKSGLMEEDLENFLEFAQRLKNVCLEGLMTIAPYFEDAEKTRPYFARAKKLFDRFFVSQLSMLRQAQHPEQSRGALNSQLILSMGMSSDFEIAIEEGSNMVRIGTAIFGERRNPDF